MATAPGTLGRAGEIHNVDPTTIIVEEGWNPRTEFAGIEDLRDSIIQNGVITPLVLQRGKEGALLLRAGERRLRATLMAIEQGVPIKSVPARIRPQGLTHDDALVETILENDGDRLSPLELAGAYRRFIAWGWSQAEIAQKFGKSQGHVSQTLGLLEATQPVREAITNNEITAREGLNIISTAKKTDDPVAAQKDATVQVKAAKITKKAEKKAARASGINPIFIKMLKEEFAREFKDVEEFTTLEVLGKGDYNHREMHIYTMGRLAVLCELCGDGKDLKDLESLLS